MCKEELEFLRHQVVVLRKENKALKTLLDNENISYAEAITNIEQYEDAVEYDINQGDRIMRPDQITDEMANRFYARFWGRQDVYSKRTVKKSNGDVNYYPQSKTIDSKSNSKAGSFS